MKVSVIVYAKQLQCHTINNVFWFNPVSSLLELTQKTLLQFIFEIGPKIALLSVDLIEVQVLPWSLKMKNIDVS